MPPPCRGVAVALPALLDGSPAAQAGTVERAGVAAAARLRYALGPPGRPAAGVASRRTGPRRSWERLPSCGTDRPGASDATSTAAAPSYRSTPTTGCRRRSRKTTTSSPTTNIVDGPDEPDTNLGTQLQHTTLGT